MTNKTTATIRPCNDACPTLKGEALHHCAGCHETFGGERAFEMHRHNFACIDPAMIRTKAGEPRLELKSRRDGQQVWGRILRQRPVPKSAKAPSAAF